MMRFHFKSFVVGILTMLTIGGILALREKSIPMKYEYGELRVKYFPGAYSAYFSTGDQPIYFIDSLTRKRKEFRTPMQALNYATNQLSGWELYDYGGQVFDNVTYYSYIFRHPKEKG